MKDRDKHINFLELKAGFLTLQDLSGMERNCHIRLYMDNTVAVTYITKMGGKISHLNELTRQIWLWCIDRNIWLSSYHLAGAKNSEADFLSRESNKDTEWSLHNEIFQKIQDYFGVCDIDLFASSKNYKIKTYASMKPDLYASVTDAFSLFWKVFNLCYIFPPFSLLGRVIQKIEQEEVKAVLRCSL